MNAYKPLIIFNVIRSVRLLTGACVTFTRFLVKGMEPNRRLIDEEVSRSLMLVTALSPIIGYDKAARIARLASDENLTLKEAALKLGLVSADEFNRIVDPRKMANPWREEDDLSP